MIPPPQSEPLPSFLITIDTEGDNLWSKPREVTTRNARSLPRFQALCEKYGLKPTYLTDREMARCPDFRAFGRDVIARGVGELREIGVRLRSGIRRKVSRRYLGLGFVRRRLHRRPLGART